MDGIFSALIAALLAFYPTPNFISPIGHNGSTTAWKGVVNSTELARVVENELAGTEGTYRIYIRHLATGESYGLNHNEVITAASMYKAWLLVGTLDEIRKGNLSAKEVLTEPAETLNRWAGLSEETAEYTSGNVTFSVERAMERMMSISHNYAAFLLTRRVGNPKVQKILRDHKLPDMHFVRPPTTSAVEMSRFLEKVYREKFFKEKKYSQELKDLLAGNQLNDGLPKKLPKGTRVEHKTGEIGPYKHDCGIVYSRGGDYIICIMTESKDPKAAEMRVADISAAVYNYFQ